MQVELFQIQVELATETTKPRGKCLSTHYNCLVSHIGEEGHVTCGLLYGPIVFTQSVTASSAVYLKFNERHRSE